MGGIASRFAGPDSELGNSPSDAAIRHPEIGNALCEVEENGPDAAIQDSEIGSNFLDVASRDSELATSHSGVANDDCDVEKTFSRVAIRCYKIENIGSDFAIRDTTIGDVYCDAAISGSDFAKNIAILLEVLAEESVVTSSRRHPGGVKRGEKSPATGKGSLPPPNPHVAGDLSLSSATEPVLSERSESKGGIGSSR